MCVVISARRGLLLGALEGCSGGAGEGDLGFALGLLWAASEGLWGCFGYDSFPCTPKAHL